MANGQRFDRRKLTAASWYFPLGTSLRVVNLSNGESVVVTITDRGPNLRLHRIVDLSEAAAANLDYVEAGLTTVFLYPLVSFEPEPAELDSRLVEPRADMRPVEYEAIALEPSM
jgi:rare lipoprotein A